MCTNAQYKPRMFLFILDWALFSTVVLHYLELRSLRLSPQHAMLRLRTQPKAARKRHLPRSLARGRRSRTGLNLRVCPFYVARVGCIVDSCMVGQSSGGRMKSENKLLTTKARYSAYGGAAGGGLGMVRVSMCAWKWVCWVAECCMWLGWLTRRFLCDFLSDSKVLGLQEAIGRRRQVVSRVRGTASSLCVVH